MEKCVKIDKVVFELLKTKRFKIFDMNALNDALLNHKY